jgi:hypothetical protein
MEYLFVALGVLVSSVAIAHEIKWWRFRRNCKFVQGSVLHEIDEELDAGTRLEIEYTINGTTKRFVSGYGGSNIKTAGDPVAVIVNLTTGQAEHYSWSNRWVLTIGPILIAFAFMFPALS